MNRSADLWKFLPGVKLFKCVLGGRNSEKSALYFISHDKLSSELTFQNFCKKTICSNLWSMVEILKSQRCTSFCMVN